MNIIVNLKNKLNNEQITKYINDTSGFGIDICLPINFIINNNKYYVQNYLSIHDVIDKYIGAIVGHFDYNENDCLVNKKIIELSSNNLNTILCIGEIKKNIDVHEYLSKRIDVLFKGVINFSNIIIAYEPSWAIGGDIVVDSEYIINNINYIYTYILKKYDISIPIYYGGSVNASVIASLVSNDVIKGFLICTFALNFDNILEYCGV